MRWAIVSIGLRLQDNESATLLISLCLLLMTLFLEKNNWVKTVGAGSRELGALGEGGLGLSRVSKTNMYKYMLNIYIYVIYRLREGL